MKDSEKVELFLRKLQNHAEVKAKLYDGVDTDMPIDTALRYATEELGEVATAISRNRLNSVKDECIDLAHCAMLIFLSVDNFLDKQKDKDIF